MSSQCMVVESDSGESECGKVSSTDVGGEFTPTDKRQPPKIPSNRITKANVKRNIAKLRAEELAKSSEIQKLRNELPEAQDPLGSVENRFSSTPPCRITLKFPPKSSAEYAAWKTAKTNLKEKKKGEEEVEEVEEVEEKNVANGNGIKRRVEKMIGVEDDVTADSLLKARALANTIRNTGADRLADINNPKRLTEVLEHTVIESFGGKLLYTTNGLVVVAMCEYTEKGSGLVTKAKLMIPTRCFQDVELCGREPIYPSRVFFYEGLTKGEGKQGDYYVLRTLTDHTMSCHQLAESARLKSIDELKRMSTIGSLSDFPEGTVFVCTGTRILAKKSKYEDSKNNEEGKPVVMAYECVVEAKRITGEVFLPYRYYETVKENIPAVLLFNGLRKSISTSRTYFDITVVLPDVAALIEVKEKE